VSSEYKNLEARIMAEMAAKAEAELGYALLDDTFKTGSVIKPGDNPWEVMGLPNAGVRAYKMDLLNCIAVAIKEQGLSQRRVATLSGLSQPDVCKLLQGQVSGFTIDRLLEVLLGVGGEMESQVRVPHTKVPKGQPVKAGSARLVAM
jgi:predicted XRE-type DNA-binding protein